MVLDDYDGQMIPGDECGPTLLTFVLQLRRNPGKKLNQEIDATGDRTRLRCVRGNDQSGGRDGDVCILAYVFKHRNYTGSFFFSLTHSTLSSIMGSIEWVKLIKKLPILLWCSSM